ncbi:MAG: hypothetical protein LC775_13290, partial [Acidobacteria bacterium]|nr:hypothetical protein [Acidobacteriota bacterium]
GGEDREERRAGSPTARAVNVVGRGLSKLQRAVLGMAYENLRWRVSYVVRREGEIRPLSP